MILENKILIVRHYSFLSIVSLVRDDKKEINYIELG